VDKILLAVNGTLMCGLALNENLVNAGAVFIREDQTSSSYRLWSIGDQYPAMQRDEMNGKSISLELWEIGNTCLLDIIKKEPPGLCLGEIELKDGSGVLGILGESWICRDAREITSWGGWRQYISRNKP
jgi:gamma-glutamylcyclotransferase (GGCT)/AIG2-like uncharacterized protein YtfP